MILDQHGKPFATEATKPVRPIASTRAVQAGASFSAYGRTIPPDQIAGFRNQIATEAELPRLLTEICRVRAAALGMGSA